jgi:hypothetical protein
MPFQRSGSGLAILTIVLLAGGCSDNGTGPLENPPFDPTNFVTQVTNPFFPLAPGTINYYEGQADDAAQTDSAEVLTEQKTILGIQASIVHDRVYTDGELIEDTFDWYAQDTDGNVWYLGEDTKELEGGQVVSTEGSWEAGVNGAQPGIIMWADPGAHVGNQYRQEFASGVAEDLGKVVAVNQTVDIAYGTLTGCVKTEDTSGLEPGVLENKYYCPDIGLTAEYGQKGSTDRNEIVAIVTP